MLVGATTPQKTLLASTQETFFMKTSSDPAGIKLRFELRDEEHSNEEHIGYVSLPKFFRFYSHLKYKCY